MTTWYFREWLSLWLINIVRSWLVPSGCSLKFWLRYDILNKIIANPLEVRKAIGLDFVVRRGENGLIVESRFKG